MKKLLVLAGVVGFKATTAGRTNAGGPSSDLVSESEDDWRLEPYELAVAQIEALLANAVAGHSTWVAKFRSGLTCLADVLERRPEMGRMLIAEGEADGGKPRETWGKAMSRAARLIDRARDEPGAAAPPRIAADAVVAKIYRVLRFQLENSASPEIREAVPSLTYHALLPYFGPDAARREMVAAYIANHARQQWPLG